ncbi:hypothetical protein C1922_01790 [Stenotrophomonas sp. ZAC14D2_NAIMI4_7]|uniref:hypothetical protein n=1 Tax=Stenotrophomonas TaxID=40323 RepID=UPI000D542146|nr:MULTISPECIES: hypothetical protein [Stenotrophomonas]AWH16150.1 hypothetical protein C1922_01790 [Stenotrophomonas sp. ZAC14D2_NAIMI4_7]AWH23928.1 hypothetical protein C1932_01690 [Stenotrophomonas sp. YAU14D1_LEIMI4_1]AWH27756.1 hypothetical protein C1931_01690 [Stenotrophomonas sp. YAU14A_MKIMI4_1]AWH31697.1 hypothetical protein C1930_01790 [Stenotrophomonas sp. SAU14A_NAIMI4_8]HAL21947.1 hypothetical protein [Stenotrophomonas sp.]
MFRVPAIVAASLLLAVPATALAQSSGKAEKKLYCWNQGKERICSDALPADAVNNAREEFNVNSGLRNAQVERALNDEERAAASTAAAQTQLDKMAELTRQRTEQAMLVTYSDEDALRRVFSERQEVLDNNLKTARYNVASLRDSLVALLGAAGDRELAGAAVADKQADLIRQRHAQLRSQQRLQASFEQQQVALKAEIETTLQRYRELKGLAPAG